MQINQFAYQRLEILLGKLFLMNIYIIYLLVWAITCVVLSYKKPL